MHATTELALAFKTFETEFLTLAEGSVLRAAYDSMISAHLLEPAVLSIRLLAAVLVGCDLYFSSQAKKTPPNEIPGKITAYFSTFCAKELRLAKKDLPKPLTDKLDKQAKDDYRYHLNPSLPMLTFIHSCTCASDAHSMSVC